MSSPPSTAAGLGINCVQCGGVLRVKRDRALLQCEYCRAGFLQRSDGEVDLYAPVGPVDRRQAARALAQQLRLHGIEDFAVISGTLFHLPFWQVNGKVVGWQCYEERETLERDTAVQEHLAPRTRSVEETVSRDISLSLPACDIRGFGLVGVASQVETLPLKPLLVERLPDDQRVCLPVRTAEAAVRAARLSCSASMLPRRAARVRQRIQLIRTQLRLIYYPVWRLTYSSGGAHFDVTIDGVRGKVLRGSYPQRVRAGLGGWLAAAGLMGLLAPLDMAGGFAVWLVWAMARARGLGPPPAVSHLPGWLSDDLRPTRTVVREMEP